MKISLCDDYLLYVYLAAVIYSKVYHLDYTSCNCMTACIDCVPPLQFTDDPNLVLFSNTGGNIFMIKFK